MSKEPHNITKVMQVISWSVHMYVIYIYYTMDVITVVDVSFEWLGRLGRWMVGCMKHCMRRVDHIHCLVS